MTDATDIAVPDDIAAAADSGAPVDVEGAHVPAAGGHDDPSGILYASLAYVSWGVMPLYWRLLPDVPPFELTVHRVFWCALFLGVVLAVRAKFSHLLALLRSPKLVATLALTSVLIAINWTVYIYCIATNQLVEASLGYYINPLISIGLGVALFGEKMSRMRLAGVILAAAAVAIQTLELGHFPWIAPVLALSFGFYGYFRKRAAVGALDGLTIETWILFPLTCGLIAFWGATGKGVFPSPHLTKDALLILGGPLTAIPLTLFSAGARRIRLSTLGFLQYLSPSITLLLAVFLFGETFTRIDAITFGCVWAALLIVALEGRYAQFKARSTPAR
jgi:chloramphenicol-sensitive protein RarD